MSRLVWPIRWRTSSTALGLGDVNAGPPAAQFLGGDEGGGATAEGVQDYVVLVAAGFDDALEEGKRLLGGIAETFLR